MLTHHVSVDCSNTDGLRRSLGLGFLLCFRSRTIVFGADMSLLFNSKKCCRPHKSRLKISRLCRNAISELKAIQYPADLDHAAPKVCTTSETKQKLCSSRLDRSSLLLHHTAIVRLHAFPLSDPRQARAGTVTRGGGESDLGLR